MHPDTILDENRKYWTGRAPGYSEVSRLELVTAQRHRWSRCLHEEISRRFPDAAPGSLRVLEVGTGPGFFAILLRELGYEVTAIDLTPAMLAQAKRNAGELAGDICFLEMNAEELRFPDQSFDVVLCRNLTWNLPHPGKAYAEWTRVLRPSGLILNFDANWYSYLFDESAREAYVRDRANTAALGIRDQNVPAEGENFDVMEDIARRVPLSGVCRPAWDLRELASLGMHSEADEQVWERVWSDEEKLNFASTPLFLVRSWI